MAALYDSVILVLLILVFIGFVLLQKEPPLPPIIRPRIKEKFQSGGSGSGSAGNSLIRTTEMAAANATICNLQPLYDSLHCAAYIARNGPTPPVLDASRLSPNELLTGRRPTTNFLTNAEGGSGLTLPSVAITGSITNLGTIVSITGRDPTPFVKPNDMIYFGYMIDVQGPYVVASVASNAITLSKKYVGPNLTNTILSVIPTAMSGSAGQTTPVLEDVSNPSPEVYSIGQGEFAQQTQAQAACAGLGGTLATKLQLRSALNNGANWDELGWISDDGNNKYAPRQTPAPTLYVTTAVSGAAICYGIKPSAQTAYTGYTNSGNPVYPTPFSSTSYYDPHRYDIVGTVLPGTSYINTKNTKLPYALGIGDLVYLNATCNQYTADRYDIDNGDGTCTAYDCKLGEVDLLDGTCQTYACKTGDTNNGDGTCSTAIVYQPPVGLPKYEGGFYGQQSYNATTPTSYYYTVPTYTNIYFTETGQNSGYGRVIYDSEAAGAGVGVMNFSYPKGVLQTPYIYNIIKSGTKSTIYTKNSSNPSYRYPKSLGPYYVAENPAIGKIMIRSKTPGDLDENGKFIDIASTTTSFVMGGVKKISHGKNTLYAITNDDKLICVPDCISATAVVDITPDWEGIVIATPIAISYDAYATTPSISFVNDMKSRLNPPGLSFTSSFGRNIFYATSGIQSKPSWTQLVGVNTGCDLRTANTISVSNGKVYASDFLKLHYKPSLEACFNETVPLISPALTFVPLPSPVDEVNTERLRLYEIGIRCRAIRHNEWYPGYTGAPTLNSDAELGILYTKASTYDWGNFSYSQVQRNECVPFLTAYPAYVQRVNTINKQVLDYETEVSFDGTYNTIMILRKSDRSVWYANTSVITGVTAPNWTRLVGINAVSVSHSNLRCVLIGTDNNLYYFPNYMNVSRTVNIPYTGSGTPIQVSFDGYAMTLVVLNSLGNVFFLNLHIHRYIENKVPPIGLQNVSISKVAYSTGGSGSKISLNKSVVGCAAGTYGPTCTPCDTGYYSPVGAPNQIPCTAGNLCIQTGQVPCPAGTYCPAGATTVLTCTAGSYCPLGTGSPVPCTPGNYCPAGATAQTRCTAGNYCPPGATAPVPCTAGNYCPAGATAPVPCTAGYYCPAGAAAQTPAPPAGTPAPPAPPAPPPQTSCTATAGNYCPAGTGAPVPCPANTYCPGGVTPPTVYNCPTPTTPPVSTNLAQTWYEQGILDYNKCYPKRYNCPTSVLKQGALRITGGRIYCNITARNRPDAIVEVLAAIDATATPLY